MNKKGRILIVGGYGAVGRVIARTLAKYQSYPLIIAGRNEQKGAEFTQSLGGEHTSYVFDINQNILTLPEDVILIINCIDHQNYAWVERCLKSGIHYIDISANYPQIQAIEKLNAVATNHQSTAVLSVGLAPGITNLLAKLCKMNAPDIHTINIYILLGLGEAHGEAAMRWVFDQLIESDSFDEKRLIHFPFEVTSRRAYNFAFPDQYTLPRTLNITQAKTWLSADPNWAGKALHLLKQSKLSNLLRNNAMMDITIRLSNQFSIGGDMYAITVQGLNQHGKIVASETINGRHEAQGTGIIAALVALHMLGRLYPYGVFHIDQLFEPTPFINELMNMNPNFHYKEVLHEQETS